jgi:PIN domain nuclease of toxin-antitoxin system
MILLDTQTLLWAAGNDKRLGRFAAARIQSSEATFFASVSLFEIELKRMVGEKWFPRAALQWQFGCHCPRVSVTGEARPV